MNPAAGRRLRRRDSSPRAEGWIGPPHAPRLILGLQPIRAAIRAHGERIGGVLLENEDAPRLAALARFARDRGVPRVEVVGRGELDRLSGGTQHQGAGAWAPELPLHELKAFVTLPSLLGLVLDRVQDPQNFGATLRSAVGLGADCVVWGEHASAPLTPSTFRAAAGGAEFAHLCRVPSLPRALSEAHSSGVAVVGLDSGAQLALSKVDLRGPVLLVVGSEHDGMTPAVRRACSAMARLVRPSGVESLNASVAAAIALYEANRQRSQSVDDQI